MFFLEFVFQDWHINKGNIKGRLFLILFRTANICAKRKVFFILGLPYLLFYKVVVQWLFALEIPWNVTVGKNLSIYHGQALILNKYVVIGENCTLRQCTTIGVKQSKDGLNSAAPIIGNNVDVGSNVCIIGAVTIRDNVIIGAGAVVVKNVDENCFVIGNPGVARKMTD